MPREPMVTLYHYTSVHGLFRIAESGAIEPRLAFDEIREASVYCTATPTACFWLRHLPRVATTEQDAVRDTRLARFTVTVPAADVGQFDYSCLRHNPPPGLPRLVKIERVVARPIPAAEWVNVAWRSHVGAAWNGLPLPLPDDIYACGIWVRVEGEAARG